MVDKVEEWKDSCLRMINIQLHIWDFPYFALGKPIRRAGRNQMGDLTFLKHLI